jgi:hypothetical protein
MLAAVGETEMVTFVAAGLTLMVALALLVVSAALVALTVTVVAVETLGAVKFPPSLIEPALALHLTAV